MLCVVFFSIVDSDEWSEEVCILAISLFHVSARDVQLSPSLFITLSSSYLMSPILLCLISDRLRAWVSPRKMQFRCSNVHFRAMYAQVPFSNSSEK